MTIIQLFRTLISFFYKIYYFNLNLVKKGFIKLFSLKFKLKFTLLTRFWLHIKLLWFKKTRLAINIYNFFQQRSSTLNDSFYWFLSRFLLVSALYPIKIFFSLFFYPIMTGYFYISIDLYIIIITVATIFYLCLLFPGFWDSVKDSDIYIIGTIQMTYVEFSFTSPYTYYTNEMLLETFSTLTQPYEEINYPGTRKSFLDRWKIMYRLEYLDEEDFDPNLILYSYNAFKEIENPYAPGMLHMRRSDRRKTGYKRSLLLNPIYYKYFHHTHEKHLLMLQKPNGRKMRRIKWRTIRVAYMNLAAGFNRGFKGLYWKSNIGSFQFENPYDTKFGGLRKRPKFRLKPRYPHCYKHIKSCEDTPFYPRFKRVGYKSLVPKDVLDFYKIPRPGLDLTIGKLELDILDDQQNFENRVSGFESAIKVMPEKSESIYKFHLDETFSNRFPEIPVEERPRECFLYGQRLLDGIHVNVLLRRTKQEEYFVFGRPRFQDLPPTYSQFKKNFKLGLLSTWAGLLAAHWPNDKPSIWLRLDQTIIDSQLFGLSAVVISKLLSPFYPNKPSTSTSVLSNTSVYQSDFSPTYNLDVLTMIRQLPGYLSNKDTYKAFPPSSVSFHSFYGGYTGFFRFIRKGNKIVPNFMNPGFKNSFYIVTGLDYHYNIKDNSYRYFYNSDFWILSPSRDWSGEWTYAFEKDYLTWDQKLTFVPEKVQTTLSLELNKSDLALFDRVPNQYSPTYNSSTGLSEFHKFDYIYESRYKKWYGQAWLNMSKKGFVGFKYRFHTLNPLEEDEVQQNWWWFTKNGYDGKYAVRPCMWGDPRLLGSVNWPRGTEYLSKIDIETVPYYIIDKEKFVEDIWTDAIKWNRPKAKPVSLSERLKNTYVRAFIPK